jgi:WD domain, G-beta repeat
VKYGTGAAGKELAAFNGHTNTILEYSPDGKTIASGSHDNTIKLWDVATGKERQARGRAAERFIRSVTYPLRAHTGARNAYDPAARDAFTHPLRSHAGPGDAHDPAAHDCAAAIAAAGAGPRAWAILDRHDMPIGRVGSNRPRCSRLMGVARLGR